jgi:Fur family transcriptional regulator, ferric uptake regulator
VLHFYGYWSDQEVALSMMQSTDQLVERLKEAGYKSTPARLAVIQVINSDEHAHLNPADVLTEARKIYPKLGRATVYRALELLTELRILRPIYMGETTPRFIRAEGGHHHLVCNECGEVIEFDECMAGDLSQSLQEEFGFEIGSHLLEFYGRCRDCK